MFAAFVWLLTFVSGGQSSLLLLHLMHELVTQAVKRQFFRIHVLHVDERLEAPSLSSPAAPDPLHSQVLEACRVFGFQW